MRRRSNFHGLTMKALVETWHPSIMIEDTYMKKAVFFPQNRTYLVNGFTSGLYHDVWKLFEHQLNFSCLIYKHEQTNWGKVEKLPNGTMFISGILDDVDKRRVDAVMIPYVNTLIRNHVVSFLPAISFMINGIAIPTSAISEIWDFTTFVKPLSNSLWMALLLTIISISVAKSVLLKEKEQNLVLKSIKNCWDSFMPIFGGASSFEYLGKASYNILIFTSLMSGYIIWTSYNAALTSELLVTGKSFPFLDLEGLTLTNWR